MQTTQGYGIHLIVDELQVKRFLQYYKGKVENKFIPLSPEEADGFQNFLKGMKH